MRAALWFFLLLVGSLAFAAEPLPPKPARYVEDPTSLLSPATREAIVEKLAAFERDTSSQILVAILPSVPGDFVMEDFTQRTAEAWGVGQREHDNGAVLFVFPNDRKLRIEVGYGLEGAIPDATAKSILDDVITPAFRSGDFDDGVARGVDALLQAAREEYTGDGLTNAERGEDDDFEIELAIILIVIALLVFGSLARARSRSRGWHYSPHGTGRRGGSGWDFWSGDGGGGGGGFDGGGGFSGGGGSFGGGGASGGW